LIISLKSSFLASIDLKDENSMAYHVSLKGEIPQTGPNTQAHVGSRLLTLRFLDIVQALDKEIDDGENVETASGRKNIFVLKKMVRLRVGFVLTRTLIAFFIQDLSDWTTTISKVSSLLQKDKEKEENSRNTGKTGQVLTENQRIGRELYLFAEWHERKSLVSQIYVNVGMACLGIRRLLQVFYKSLAILHL
jgi:hypothetical protein